MIQRINVFTEQECADLINLHNNYEPGRVGNRVVEHIRSNSVCWIEYDVISLAHHFPPHDWIANPCQLSRYAPGESYDWHHDVILGRSSSRLYTLTVTLQPAAGAHIEIGDTVIDLKPGEGVVFDSDLQHRATAPTHGTRYAFTTWAMRRNK
jgi:hypothetical protein